MDAPADVADLVGHHADVPRPCGVLPHAEVEVAGTAATVFFTEAADRACDTTLATACGEKDGHVTIHVLHVVAILLHKHIEQIKHALLGFVRVVRGGPDTQVTDGEFDAQFTFVRGAHGGDESRHIRGRGG